MPRPKSKAELLQLGASNFKNLINFINELDDTTQQLDFPEGTMNRNIRDVLAHLNHWHLMILEWYTIGMAGKKPDMPAKGYSWKTTPDLNRWIHQHYLNTPLETAKTRLLESHEGVMALINNHSNEELFTKKYYKWTGSTSLGAYLVSATSSHYDWAFKLIKKALKKGLTTNQG